MVWPSLGLRSGCWNGGNGRSRRAGHTFAIARDGVSTRELDAACRRPHKGARAARGAWRGSRQPRQSRRAAVRCAKPSREPGLLSRRCANARGRGAADAMPALRLTGGSRMAPRGSGPSRRTHAPLGHAGRRAAPRRHPPAPQQQGGGGLCPRVCRIGIFRICRLSPECRTDVTCVRNGDQPLRLLHSGAVRFGLEPFRSVAAAIGSG